MWAPPLWWAVPGHAPGRGPGLLLSLREYKELRRKERNELEAAHAAAGRNPKSEASMERRARRKGAVPPQFSLRGRGRPRINSLEAWRLGQKVMEVRYAKNCGFHAAYRHVAETESERKRMAQEPESVRKKRRCSADTVEYHVQVLQNETDPHFRRALRDDPLLAPLLGGDFEEGRLRWLEERASLKRQLPDAADDEERMKVIHLHLLLRSWYPLLGAFRKDPDLTRATER